MRIVEDISKNLAIALTCAVFSGCGREEARQATAEPTPASVSNPQLDQIRQRGYADLGEGVFLIPGRIGREVGDQLQFGQAVANFRKDHPDLEIAREIRIDGDTNYGGFNSSLVRV